MATRRETSKRKALLRATVRNMIADPTSMLLPSVRELADAHGLSRSTVSIVLRELSTEGLITTSARNSTRIGPRVFESKLFLFVFSAYNPCVEIRRGFDLRIASHGGMCMDMPIWQARQAVEAGNFPAVDGYWDSTADPDGGLVRALDLDAPTVGLRGSTPRSDADTIESNDLEAAFVATSHLLHQGHRRIAFVGVHRATGSQPHLRWSMDRAEGWRRVMEEEGRNTDDMIILPREHLMLWTSLPEYANQAAHRLMARPEITAFVAANDILAYAIIEQFRRVGMPPEKWPSVVGFDNHIRESGTWLSSMTLSASEVGAAAADLVWSRAIGTRLGPPIRHQVPFVLIPRPSSRPGWGKALATESLFPASSRLSTPATPVP